jgi:hypothetical protein
VPTLLVAAATLAGICLPAAGLPARAGRHGSILRRPYGRVYGFLAEPVLDRLRPCSSSGCAVLNRLFASVLFCHTL